MARIDLIDLAHSYGDAREERAWALKPMTLSWSDGGAYALLGPSGCGKTTLLNLLSGLIKPTRGRILFDGRDVTTLEPEQRNIAQVFQFPVIYDTMTVFDNLAFPLRNRRFGEREVRKRVTEIAEMLDLQSELQRRARGLSPDAKQKISLGRGLVRPDVAAVLFDEPLTVIDPHVKWLLRRKLKQLHQQLNLTLIYVTHDQTEALTFADQVMVMTHGEVVQVGTPQALFETPAHRFVGHFIGTPGMNFLACEWRDGAHVQGVRLQTASATPAEPHTSLVLGIRPEYVSIAKSSGDNCVPAEVQAVEDRGTHVLARLRIGEQSIWAKLRASEPPALGPVFAYLPADKCAVYANERRLS